MSGNWTKTALLISSVIVLLFVKAEGSGFAGSGSPRRQAPSSPAPNYESLPSDEGCRWDPNNPKDVEARKSVFDFIDFYSSACARGTVMAAAACTPHAINDILKFMTNESFCKVNGRNLCLEAVVKDSEYGPRNVNQVLEYNWSGQVAVLESAEQSIDDSSGVYNTCSSIQVPALKGGVTWQSASNICRSLTESAIRDCKSVHNAEGRGRPGRLPEFVFFPQYEAPDDYNDKEACTRFIKSKIQPMSRASRTAANEIGPRLLNVAQGFQKTSSNYIDTLREARMCSGATVAVAPASGPQQPPADQQPRQATPDQVSRPVAAESRTGTSQRRAATIQTDEQIQSQLPPGTSYKDGVFQDPNRTQGSFRQQPEVNKIDSTVSTLDSELQRQQARVDAFRSSGTTPVSGAKSGASENSWLSRNQDVAIGGGLLAAGVGAVALSQHNKKKNSNNSVGTNASSTSPTSACDTAGASFCGLSGRGATNLGYSLEAAANQNPSSFNSAVESLRNNNAQIKQHMDSTSYTASAPGVTSSTPNAAQINTAYQYATKLGILLESGKVKSEDIMAGIKSSDAQLYNSIQSTFQTRSTASESGNN